MRVGSSPLTRGKHRPQARQLQRLGLIPTHAGKTLTEWAGPSIRRAHPRSRGENISPTSAVPGSRGSSPLTRGKLVAHSPVLQACRLIPAHAGKTSHHHPPKQASGAHPRSRGENSSKVRGVLGAAGSSPLKRGKPLAARFASSYRGLIPAHAGKPPGIGRRNRRGRAHPRSRRENVA